MAYLALNVLYSTFLKRIALLDVFIVAAGFLFRVIAGGLVIRVAISPWLIVCTTLLALFIALSKRRHELVLLGRRASDHRAILADYSPYFLDQLISIVTASTVVSYALYTLSPDVQSKFPGKRLEMTIPFVLFGIFRYLHLIHHRRARRKPHAVFIYRPRITFGGAFVGGIGYFDHLSLASASVSGGKCRLQPLSSQTSTRGTLRGELTEAEAS